MLLLLKLFQSFSNYIKKFLLYLLLLLTGILLREIITAKGWALPMSQKAIEFFGVIGLVMIVLEAGMDLKLGRDKVKLITNSFFAAFFILIISAAGISACFYYWLHEPIRNCIVYAIPLSIMSSSIVIPSSHHLSVKKEFLV